MTDHANGTQRFEVDGADFAQQFCTDLGIGSDRCEIIWQAIALHTSVGIASRLRPEIALAHAGIGADIQISVCPDKAPPFSFPGVLVHQQTNAGPPTYNQLIQANPWGNLP